MSPCTVLCPPCLMHLAAEPGGLGQLGRLRRLDAPQTLLLTRKGLGIGVPGGHAGIWGVVVTVQLRPSARRPPLHPSVRPNQRPCWVSCPKADARSSQTVVGRGGRSCPGCGAHGPGALLSTPGQLPEARGQPRLSFLWGFCLPENRLNRIRTLPTATRE